MSIHLKAFRFENILNEILGKNAVIGDKEDKQGSPIKKLPKVMDFEEQSLKRQNN